MIAYKMRKNRDISKLRSEYRVAKKVLPNDEYRKIAQENSNLIKNVKNDYKISKNKAYYNYYSKKLDLKAELKHSNAILRRYKKVGTSQELNRARFEVRKNKRIILSNRSDYENKVYGDGKKRSVKFITYRSTFFSMVVFLFVLFVIPFFFMFNTSFKSLLESVTTKIYHFPEHATGANYTEAIKAMNFWESTYYSLLITVVSNFLIIILASMAAWMLVRTKTWYSKAIFYTFLVAMILPFQAIMLPLMAEMGKINFLNIPGLIFMYVGFGTALSVFLMHGFLKGVPTSLEEAASISGMGPFRIFFKIILPIMKPILVTVVILNTMWIWNDFLLPVLVLGSSNAQTLPVALYTRGIGAFGVNINMIMAGLTIIIIPVVIFFIFTQRGIIAGIANGAVK